MKKFVGQNIRMTFNNMTFTIPKGTMVTVDGSTHAIVCEFDWLKDDPICSDFETVASLVSDMKVRGLKVPLKFIVDESELEDDIPVLDID